MTSFSTKATFNDMLSAAAGVFRDDWPALKDYAEGELKKLAETGATVTKLYASGAISKAEAKALVEMQKNTARTVMLTIQGIGLIIAEKAVNAVLKVLRAAVNTAVGVKLL